MRRDLRRRRSPERFPVGGRVRDRESGARGSVEGVYGDLRLVVWDLDPGEEGRVREYVSTSALSGVPGRRPRVKRASPGVPS